MPTSNVFKSAVSFNGKKPVVGGSVLVSYDLGEGPWLYPGTITAVSDVAGSGIAAATLLCPSTSPAVQDGVGTLFEVATPTYGGPSSGTADPTTLTSGQWMWLADADAS